MRNAQTGTRLRRSRPRRLAFAATALLAGCATAGREAATVQSFAGPTIAGQTRALLFRVTPPGAAEAALFGGARLWQLDGGERAGYDVPGSPSRAAQQGGWLLFTHLRPGTWFMRLEGVGGSRAAAPADITFRVPPAPPAVTYIGTFRVACDAAGASGTARPCRVEPVPIDESAAAAALVAAEGSGLAPPVTSLARPYPPSLAATGLAAPSVPDFRVDTRLWLAAIDWAAFATTASVPTPPADGPNVLPEAPPGPRSAVPDWSGARLVSVSGDLSAEIAAYAVVLIIYVPIYLIARAIAQDQRNRRNEAEARRQAETLRATALAQERWGTCTAGIAATLAPDNVERHLRTTLAPGREAGRRAALPGPWQATVTRVIFRHCGTTPDQHGVEVATRWTATRPGEAEPAFDVAYSRTVADATPDGRLVHSTRPPWEIPVSSEAACRPLADYCGAGGSALLLQEVTRGVTEARDAIAATR